MTFALSITKEQINQLPMYKFGGTVTVIETTAESLAAVEVLKNEKVLGFDTETRAAFKKNQRYDVALLQLATETHAYLFRLNKFPLNPELTAILADPDIVKAGVAIRDDIKALQKRLDFEDQNFVDLAKVAKEKKIEKFGLRALTAILLGRRLSKKEKISNWDRSELTSGQVAYAACDAVVGYQIYQALHM